jgi:hypothetical protein
MTIWTRARRLDRDGDDALMGAATPAPRRAGPRRFGRRGPQIYTNPYTYWMASAIAPDPEPDEPDGYVATRVSVPAAEVNSDTEPSAWFTT